MIARSVRQERQRGTGRWFGGRFVDGRPPSDRMRRPAIHQIPHRVSSSSSSSSSSTRVSSLTAVYSVHTSWLTVSSTANHYCLS